MLVTFPMPCTSPFLFSLCFAPACLVDVDTLLDGQQAGRHRLAVMQDPCLEMLRRHLAVVFACRGKGARLIFLGVVVAVVAVVVVAIDSSAPWLSPQSSHHAVVPPRAPLLYTEPPPPLPQSTSTTLRVVPLPRPHSRPCRARPPPPPWGARCCSVACWLPPGPPNSQGGGAAVHSAQ